MLGFDFKKVSQLNRYQKDFQDLGLIGNGGFAQVYKVRNLLDNRIYAAKIIKIKPSLDDEGTQQKIFRIISESKAHSHLSHPNILDYHGCWVELQSFTEEQKAEMLEQQTQQEPEFEMILLNESLSSDGIVFGSNSSGEAKSEVLQQQPIKRRQSKKLGDGSKLSDYKEVRVYLITELCEINLQAFLHKRSCKSSHKDLSPSQILQNYQIALEVINGLNYLHSKRMIHRDIKLQNIMIGLDGKCKVIDFGLAKRVKYWKASIQDQIFNAINKEQLDEDQKFSSSIGTKLFSSPEQASSEKYDYRTDIYSLAVVIVLMFNSYTTAHQQRQLLQKIRKRQVDQMKIPQNLKQHLYKCLGSENERSSLSQLKKCIKQLMRQLIQYQKIPLEVSRDDNYNYLKKSQEKSSQQEILKKLKMISLKES